MTIKLVFMGSPEFAPPHLRALAAHYSVVGVVTQPNQPAGRGRVMTPPPIKNPRRRRLGLPVIQPRRLPRPQSDGATPRVAPGPDHRRRVRANSSPAVLDLPPHGCVGGGPRPYLPTDGGPRPFKPPSSTGTPKAASRIMKMDPGVDTGPMLSRRAIPIDPDDTAGDPEPKLAQLGTNLLLDTLPLFPRGTDPRKRRTIPRPLTPPC